MMRFSEFNEAFVDIEKDPAVQLYRMLTKPFDFGTPDAEPSADTAPDAAPATGQPVKPVRSKVTSSGQGPAFRDPNFKAALERTASNLGVDPNHLIAIMKQESRLNPQAVNKDTQATGLIQFMPNVAQELGTSTRALYRMSASQQMQWVEKYFRMRRIRPGMGLGDLYLAVFYPAAVGKSDNHVVSRAGKAIYRQNSGLDRNKDGIITVGDIKNSVARFA